MNNNLTANEIDIDPCILAVAQQLSKMSPEDRDLLRDATQVVIATRLEELSDRVESVDNRLAPNPWMV